MCKRTQDARMVLNHMLEGKQYSKRQLSTITPEDSGRIFNYIRNELFVPVVCDQLNGEAIWYITEKEIERYFNQRERQKEEMELHIIDKQLDRLSSQIVKAIENGRADTLQAMVDEKRKNKANMKLA